MNEVLNRTFLHNTVYDYVIALSIVAGGILLLRLFRGMILKRLKRLADKTETRMDKYILEALERFGLPLLNLTFLYFAFKYLTLPPRGEKITHDAMVIVLIFYSVRLVSFVIRQSLMSYVTQERGAEKLKQFQGITFAINLLLWAIASIFLFDNLGYNVTTLLTGLGVGGVAIALATQNILGDLFNYFVIFFDKPFEIGDYITLDDKKGTVEYIGVKSTRLTALTGEQLIISNSDLTKSRVHNFKRLKRRRVAFTFGVAYQTTLEQLKEIPEILKKVTEAQPMVTFYSTYFVSYSKESLNFEVVYFIENPKLDPSGVAQGINLGIFEAFKQKGIQFAYTSDMVHNNEPVKFAP